ncbi:MAG: GAF domain-containing protein [Proteobacteria bacterium]|nr:GAF domain-containing protein [Pseudomonadota bacterium]
MPKGTETGPHADHGPDRGHFTIRADRQIVDWDEAAARLLGISRRIALGERCDRAIGGKDAFGRAVCGAECPAARALEAGEVTGRSRFVVRGADGARLRLDCDLIAFPSGGALGRLRRADDCAQDLAHDLAAVAALATAVSTQPPRTGLHHVLRFLLQATRAEVGEALLVEPNDGGVVRSFHTGRFAHAFDEVLRFEPGEGFPGLVLAHGLPEYTDRLPHDVRFLRERVKRAGFTGYACAPLTSRGGAFGCLALGFRQSDIDFDGVLDLLRGIGTPIGLALDAALARVTNEGSQLLDGIERNPRERLPQALRALLHETVRLGGADGGELHAVGEAAPSTSLVAHEGRIPQCPVLRSGAVERCPAFTSGAPRILRGRRESWPSACRGVTHPGGAWCCIPMSSGGASVGVIRLLYRRLRAARPSENMVVIERLASAAASKVCAAGEREVASPGVTEATAATAQPDSCPEAASRYLEIRCFGPFALTIDGTPVIVATIRRRRVLALLGILLTHHDQPQSKDALIEMLWPGADPELRGKQFHVVVHDLRRLLEPPGRAGSWLYVRSSRDRYVFDTHSSCRIDVLDFRALIGIAHKADTLHDEPAAIRAYEAAADLYRGDYLQDEPFAEWPLQTRDELREDCLGALGRLEDLWSTRYRWDKCIASARRALAIDPLREQSHRALMYALWASGRRDEAVRQYECCAALLRKRLDLPPLPETDQLFARIRATPRPQTGRQSAAR